MIKLRIRCIYMVGLRRTYRRSESIYNKAIGVSNKLAERGRMSKRKVSQILMARWRESAWKGVETQYKRKWTRPEWLRVKETVHRRAVATSKCDGRYRGKSSAG